MFPLGSVLVPTAVLPLHVFEPRYRQLTKDCLAADGEFGVVLIERGSEVGGGDVRGNIGTVAKIVESAEMDDGRFALITVGVRRIKVVRWLPDEPYPNAEVEDFPDGDDDDAELAAIVDDTIGPLRRLLALCAEMGEPAAPATVDIDDDPRIAGFQLTALAPVGPADRQRLLAAPTMTERVQLVAAMVGEQLDDAARRLELDARD
jgi:Lon protease-like protein